MAFYPIVVTLLLYITGGDSATLTVVPGSTAKLNTLVHHTCEGIGNSLLWLVGTAPLNNTIKLQRDISVTDSHSGSKLVSVLTIPALPGNDRVEIGCWINFIPVGSSQLVVTGVSPVEDLHVGFTSDESLNLTWSPPVFYSNDVPFGSTFNYRVLITNETGVEPIVDRIVSTTSISLPDIMKCDAFNVNVTALIVDQYTSVSNSDRNNGSYSIQIGEPLLKLSSVTQSPVLTIPFNVTCTPSLCYSTVVIEPSCDGYIKSAHLEINGSNDDNLVIQNHTIVDLESFKHCEITISVMDRKNLTRDQANVAISTYHVQNVTIDSQQYTNGSVRVKCLFIEKSTDDGCHVIFTSTTDQAIEPQTFNITGSNERIVTLSVSSDYTVTAYDLVNGTIIGPSVEYPIPVEVIILPVPPPVSATSSISSSSSTMIPIATSQATTLTVSTTSDVSAVPRPTSESTDGKQQQLTIISGSTVGGILVVVVIVFITIGAIFVRRNKRRKQSVTLHGEIAMTRNAQADQNDYDLPETVTASGPSQIVFVGVSNGTDQLTQTSETAHENPYNLTHDEFLNHQDSTTSADSGIGNRTHSDSIEPSLTSSPDSEVQSNSAATGTTVNENMGTYADLATIDKEDAPCKPPSGIQPVTYSKVSPHTNKRVDCVNPDDPPIKYENLDWFARLEYLTKEAEYLEVPFVSSSSSEEGNCLADKRLMPPSRRHGEDSATRVIIGIGTNDSGISTEQSYSYRGSPHIEEHSLHD